MLTNFLSQELNFNLGKFKTNIFFSFIFKYTGQVCSGFGWGSEPITLELTTNFDFANCYKTVISDMCEWDNTFRGENAKWYDECALSGDTAKLWIQNWDVMADDLSDGADQISLIGGTSIDNRGCWQFAWWSKWTPYVATAGLDMVKYMLFDSGAHTEMPFD